MTREDRPVQKAPEQTAATLIELAHLGSELCAALAPEALKTVLLRQFMELFDPKEFLLAWREPKAVSREPCKVFFSSLTVSTLWPVGAPLPPADYVLNLAKEAKEPLIYALSELNAGNLPPRLKAHAEGALIVLPLRLSGRFCGFAEILLPEELLTNEVLKNAFLAAYACFMAIAIKNSQAFASTNMLAISDDCTTLYNARFLEKCLEDEVSRAVRYDHPLVCLFLDLDYFKLVNDNHGHLNGSYLLQQVAIFIKKFIRRTDIAFRYGGDEFVVLMPETTKHGGQKAAERLLELLKSEVFYTLDKKPLNISASIGVAAFDGQMSGDELLSLADKAMYYVKEHGRGAVKVE